VLETKVKVSVSKQDDPRADDVRAFEVANGGEPPFVGAPVIAIPGEPSEVPALFVGRWVRLDFTGWPRNADGQAFLLNIRVIKVWRLAPPAFRRSFAEALRRKEKPSRRAANIVFAYSGLNRDSLGQVRPPASNIAEKINQIKVADLPFVGGGGSSTFNRKLKFEQERYRRRQHDTEVMSEAVDSLSLYTQPKGPTGAMEPAKCSEGHDLEVFKQDSATCNVCKARKPTKYQCSRNCSWNVCEDCIAKELVKENFNNRVPWEFHMSRSKDLRQWRSKIYALDDDARECTFHPRTARNVPRHVNEQRDMINAYGFIYGADKEARGIKTYIEKISPKVNHYFDTLPSLSGKKNYSFVKRQMTFAVAKRYYHEGHFIKALKTLESGTIDAGQQPHPSKVMDGFAIQQIVDYYRCFAHGCGKLIDLCIDDRAHGRCVRCKGTFCAAHLAPEAHNCQQIKEEILQKEKLKQALSMKAGSAGALDGKRDTILGAIEDARKAGVNTKFLNYAGWFLQQVEEARKVEEEKLARGMGGIPGQQESDLGPKFVIQNEEKFNDKAERALLNEVLKLVEAIRAARKAKAKQHLSLDQLSQSVKHYGAVRLLERPFRQKNVRQGFEQSSVFSKRRQGAPLLPALCAYGMQLPSGTLSVRAALPSR
jgi:hypothetical protein